MAKCHPCLKLKSESSTEGAHACLGFGDVFTLWSGTESLAAKKQHCVLVPKPFAQSACPHLNIFPQKTKIHCRIVLHCLQGRGPQKITIPLVFVWILAAQTITMIQVAEGIVCQPLPQGTTATAKQTIKCMGRDPEQPKSKNV